MSQVAYRAQRRYLAPFAACALVFATGCGGGGKISVSGPEGPSSPTSPTTPTNPTSSLVGGWTGTTGQGKPFSFLVTAEGITLMMVGWRVQGASCTDDITQFLSRIPASTAYPITSGAVSVTSTGSLANLTISGTLQGSGTGSGTMQVNGVRCPANASTTWTATRATGPEVNLAGLWNASFASSLVPRTDGSLFLSQTGAAVTGTYSVNSTGAGGTFVATVSGRMATFTLTQMSGCSGSFTGHAVLMPSPELLVYYYAGSDCLGTHSNGNGSASK